MKYIYETSTISNEIMSDSDTTHGKPCWHRLKSRLRTILCAALSVGACGWADCLIILGEKPSKMRVGHCKEREGKWRKEGESESNWWRRPISINFIYCNRIATPSGQILGFGESVRISTWEKLMTRHTRHNKTTGLTMVNQNMEQFKWLWLLGGAETVLWIYGNRATIMIFARKKKKKMNDDGWVIIYFCAMKFMFDIFNAF